MLNRINNCSDAEELHYIGMEIGMSEASKEVKEPLYRALEERLKSLSSLMAEQSDMSLSDIEESSYEYSE